MTAIVWLTLDDVKDRTTLSRPEIERFVASREFPSPVQGADGACVWREGEIDDWIAGRPRVEDIPRSRQTKGH